MWAFKASFTVILRPKCSWCEFHPLVVLTLFGHFWHKESLLNLPIPVTLSGLGRGGGSEAQMTRLAAANQNPFIHFSKIDQSGGGCCCSFFINMLPQNLQNEKIFLYLEIAEIDMGGNLGREGRFWT